MRTQCISDLQHFETFRNCCLFCTLWLIRNFYSGDAHHANYGKRCLDHHFKHCAHSVYQILRIFQGFQNCSLFCTFCLLRSFYSWDAQHANYGKKFKSSFPTLRTLCIRDLHCFRTSQNCGLFCRFWLLRNLNSVDSRHAYYGEHCSNHHFRHCAQCVSQIYSVWKLFQIAVCFAHFGLFEISTTVISNMLTIANIV